VTPPPKPARPRRGRRPVCPHCEAGGWRGAATAARPLGFAACWGLHKSQYVEQPGQLNLQEVRTDRPRQVPGGELPLAGHRLGDRPDRRPRPGPQVTDDNLSKWTTTYAYELNVENTPQFTSIYRLQQTNAAAKAFPSVPRTSTTRVPVAVPGGSDHRLLGHFQRTGNPNGFADPRQTTLPVWVPYGAASPAMAGERACDADPAGNGLPSACSVSSNGFLTTTTSPAGPRSSLSGPAAGSRRFAHHAPHHARHHSASGIDASERPMALPRGLGHRDSHPVIDLRPTGNTVSAALLPGRAPVRLLVNDRVAGLARSPSTAVAEPAGARPGAPPARRGRLQRESHRPLLLALYEYRRVADLLCGICPCGTRTKLIVFATWSYRGTILVRLCG